MIELNNSNFKEEVLNYNGKVVVDIWATWCGKCKMIKPKYIDLSNTKTDYKFCTLEADSNNELMEELKVVNLPTFIIYENGKIVKQGGMEVLSEL